MVSVVIPSYNRAHLIRDALDSVWAQTYRPIEILVVDDGSTDATVQVVREWTKGRASRDEGREPEGGGRSTDADSAERRGSSVESGDHVAGNLSSLTPQAASRSDSPPLSVRYLRQENLGGNPARNHGIREASGEYIAFLDSDDAWEPEKLEKQLKRFQSANTVAVYCGVRHLDFDSGKELETTKRQYPEGNLLEALLVRDVTVQTSAYVVRRKVFQQVGAFDESLRARQDWDMWIRVASAGRIACVPEPLVRFREHEGERTASNPLKEIEAYRKIRQKYADLLGRASLPCRLQARAAYLKRLGRVHNKHPDLDSAKGRLYAAGALLNWPFDFDNWAALGGMFLPRNFRQGLHRSWNAVFGATRFAIRSH